MALSIEDVVSSMRTQPSLDTFEVDVKTTMTMQGQVTQISSHLICKGPDKLWMEQDSPMGVIRTIRNGTKAQTIDLASGKKQNVDLDNLRKMGVSSPKMESFFSKGRYSAPVKSGPNLFVMSLEPGSDSSMESRSLTYDARLKSLAKVEQIGRNQDSTIMEMSYGRVHNLTVLKRLDMHIRMQGLASKVSVAYSNFVVPESITDAIFNIQD